MYLEVLREVKSLCEVTQHVLMELCVGPCQVSESRAMLKHPLQREEQQAAIPSLVLAHSRPSLHQSYPFHMPASLGVASPLCAAESVRGRLPGPMC